MVRAGWDHRGRMTKARRAVGAYGERVAAEHLVAAGLVLLDRNWRCTDGELDIVARDGADTLVICEVKTRRWTAGRWRSPPRAATTWR